MSGDKRPEVVGMSRERLMGLNWSRLVERDMQSTSSRNANDELTKQSSGSLPQLSRSQSVTMKIPGHDQLSTTFKSDSSRMSRSRSTGRYIVLKRNSEQKSAPQPENKSPTNIEPELVLPGVAECKAKLQAFKVAASDVLRNDGKRTPKKGGNSLYANKDAHPRLAQTWQPASPAKNEIPPGIEECRLRLEAFRKAANDPAAIRDLEEATLKSLRNTIG